VLMVVAVLLYIENEVGCRIYLSIYVRW